MTTFKTVISCLLTFIITVLLAQNWASHHNKNLIIAELEFFNMVLEDENKSMTKEIKEVLVQAVLKNDENLIKSLLENDVIGFTNNNPANVKGKDWKGQIGNDEHGHAIFEHYMYSLRASAKILIAYQEKHKLLTLTDMMNRYCTANQDLYATFISKRIGVAVDEEFNVRDYLPEILKCIVHFENGSNPYPDHVYILLEI